MTNIMHCLCFTIFFVDNCKTLFRAEGGLELYCKHSFFSRYVLLFYF